MNTSEIENALRQAPRPVPPAGLKERLQAQAPFFGRGGATQEPSPLRAPAAWLARWWPALGPAAVSLACAAVLTVQHAEIRELQAALQAQPPAAPATEPVSAPADRTSANAAAPADSSASEQAEIARLQALVDKLAAEISQLERTRASNQDLRKQLAAGPATSLTAEETKALEAARDRALSIQCVNNLKQLGLAASTWALDNGDATPANLLQMTNEMGTPKVLFCPADGGRQAAADWASFTPANCSYEYLAPSAPESEPERVLFRCPVHGSIGLCDGSVQLGIAKTHPDWFVQRDGKLYFQPIKPSADGKPN